MRGVPSAAVSRVSQCPLLVRPNIVQVSTRRTSRAPAMATENNNAPISDGSDWQSLRRQAEGVINLAVGHPHHDALPNEILARAFQRAAVNLTEDPCSSQSSTETNLGEKIQMSYVARRGDANALRVLAEFLTKAYAQVGVCVHEEEAANVPYEQSDTAQSLLEQSVTPQSLLIVAGASHGLDVACAALTQPGDTVVVETPTYFLASDVFRDRQLNVVAVPGKGLIINKHGDDTKQHHSFDVGLFEAKLRAGGLRPKLVYLVPTHGNPRGGTLPFDDRKRLIRLAREFQFYVVADEVYHLLSWGTGEDAPPKRFVEVEQILEREENRGRILTRGSFSSSSEHEDDPYAEPVGGDGEEKIDSSRVVSLGSFSKILAPGLRVGWIESSPALMDTIANRGFLSSGGCVSPLAFSIVAGVIASGDQRVWLENLRNRYESSASALAKAVRLETKQTKWRLHTTSTKNTPTGGYFAWLTLPETCDMAVFARHAKHERVAFLPGKRCVAGASDDDVAERDDDDEEADCFLPNAKQTSCERCVRLCFAYLEEADIVEGVERLARAVRAADTM